MSLWSFAMEISSRDKANRHRICILAFNGGVAYYFLISLVARSLTASKWPSVCVWHVDLPEPVYTRVNTLRPRQNGRHFADDIFKCIFLNENDWIPIEISPKFVPKGPINNIPALVQIMALRRRGDKPLSEPMMVSFLTHICVTRPQWVNKTSCN